MAGRGDEPASVGEQGDAGEGDGGVEGVPDEEVAVVESCGEDFDFKLVGAGLGLRDVAEV